MAYDFNDDLPVVDPERPDPRAASSSAVTDETPANGAAGNDHAVPVPAEPAASPALMRFRTCRWQQPIEKGGQEFCTHREVKPYAGTTAFDADAWCGDCQHYKLRRIPKKRPREEDWSY